MLPGTDGLTLCRWIRERSTLPVILLTARGEETDRIVGLELGADDYVTKPFSPREVAARVRSVLRRAQAQPAPRERLEFDGLVIDAGTREVALDGTPLRLTAKEFDLLLFLASHPRRVFSRDQLMQSVWGYTAALDTGTVTVHLRRLRTKVERDPSRPARLETVWGVGYRFDAVIALALVVAAATLVAARRRHGAPAAAPDGPPAARGPRAARRRLPLAAVLLSGWVMFHMGDDVKILAVAATSAAAAAATALAIGSNLARRIRDLADASHELAEGDLTARAPESGPRELAQLGGSFNEMAANLERLFDARRELVEGASHDLRTPIGSMLAMLEAIDDGLATPDEYLPALRDQARRLAVLVEDLFELARIDSGALAHELRPVSLVGLVDGCLRGVAAEAAARRVHLERRVEQAPPDVKCAPEEVERVLANLLANALGTRRRTALSSSPSTAATMRFA